MDLRLKANEIRQNIAKCIGSFGFGHIGGCLSIVEVLTLLYYKYMNVDPKNPKMEGRDRLVVSKGHSGPAVYATLCAKGYFGEDTLVTLNRLHTKLPSHCDMVRTPGIDFTAGSLGQGFSAAVGIAIGSKIKNDGARIYTIVGDGESQEGQIWEAGMLAASKKLDNLIAFTDRNKYQIDGAVDDINGLGDLAAKWTAFGWNTIEVRDGNDLEQVDAAIQSALTVKGKPSMIILNTLKGKGIKLVEDMGGAANHHVQFTKEMEEAALKQLREEV